MSGGPLTPVCPLEQFSRVTGREFTPFKAIVIFSHSVLSQSPYGIFGGHFCIFTVCSDKAIMGNEQRLGKSVASFFLILLDLDCS